LGFLDAAQSCPVAGSGNADITRQDQTKDMFAMSAMDGRIFEVTKSCGFDAAHRLPAGPPESPYVRLHGHSFRVEATLRGPAQPPIGWVEDLGKLDAALKGVCDELDHTLLNEHAGLESPTLEALCAFFAGRLSQAMPTLCEVVVSRPSIGERCRLAIG
jgi:6-pyruvoyltetrahydropterin/6-carboxytetrahydropterin synthase